MIIYIASSWRNQHSVEMLTEKLRAKGHEVLSWIENNYGENPNSSDNDGKFNFDEWVNSELGDKAYQYDTMGAIDCELFIYVGPAGKDAAAECGMCYGANMHTKDPAPMLGLYAKGEDFGLMRKMFDAWFTRVSDLLDRVDSIADNY